ncbi:hypothetical protein [Tepidimicrobium xylanilyticum]|uniref:Pyruvate ferredoxin oxidoreductase beta subunit C terminal n=1 Tax=Tepidimicrobium xylanilyticum TaxID=1123352 RepID=A0A1H3B9S2_9FIRM|nr:hypothetical protein [Tepidimicrobium xylanilyticum]SDX38780.1 Pyruvate ferredoxin oxidoreductase beta subunit C terminal [Tepidimicrobium xylanilyticum]
MWNRVDTFAWYKKRIYYLDEDYDYTNKDKAYKKALEFGDRIPLGISYKAEKKTYEDRFQFIKDGPPLVDRELDPMDAEKLMEEFI